VDLRPSRQLSRDIFVRSALVEAISRRGRHFSPTTAARRRDRRLEHKVAPADILVDES